jgi:hypothetical protein
MLTVRGLDMAFISVTRLHLRSLRFFPLFLWHALATGRQAERAPGLLGGTLALEGLRGFWTMTVWTDESSMRAYRIAGAHRRAMPHLLHWCDEASVTHWAQADVTLPDSQEMLRRMVTDGRPSKVNHPSAAQAARRIEAKIPRFRRPLRPANAPA